MPNSIIQSHFFLNIYIFAKQIKYILKRLAIKVEIFIKIIYIDRVKPMISIRYDKFKYNLLFIDDTI